MAPLASAGQPRHVHRAALARGQGLAEVPPQRRLLGVAVADGGRDVGQRQRRRRAGRGGLQHGPRRGRGGGSGAAVERG